MEKKLLAIMESIKMRKTIIAAIGVMKNYLFFTVSGIFVFVFSFKELYS